MQEQVTVIECDGRDCPETLTVRDATVKAAMRAADWQPWVRGKKAIDLCPLCTSMVNALIAV